MNNKRIKITSKKEKKKKKTKECNCPKEKGEHNDTLWSSTITSLFVIQLFNDRSCFYITVPNLFQQKKKLMVPNQTSDDLKIYQRKLVNGNSLMWYLLTETFLKIWLYIYG